MSGKRIVMCVLIVSMAALSCCGKKPSKESADNMEGGSAVKGPTVGGESPEKPPTK